jgi:ADP-ribosylglycohydrolase
MLFTLHHPLNHGNLRLSGNHHLYQNQPMHKRWPIRTALLGFALADALGVPYEFTDREDMDNTPATGISGFGTYHQPPGTWSDDTSMALCVMENLLEGGDDASLAEKFLRWYGEGYLTAHGDVFDIGFQTGTVLSELDRHGYQRRTDGFNSQAAGNGALMRVFPYAFLPEFHHAFPLMLHDIRITHPSSISTECCLFFVRLLRSLVEGYSKEKAWQDAIDFMQKREGFHTWDHDYSATTYLNRLRNPGFVQLNRVDIKSSGFVVHTLEAAVWSFMNSTTYADAVLLAVNLGDDTDTVAAVCGALASVFYGPDSLPSDWLDALANRLLLEEMAEKWEQTAE